MSRRTPTNLDYALLGLLHQAPQSGYDLRKVFAETALGTYSSSPGAIYPALKRLEAKGFINGEVDSTIALRPRKVFTPTAAGYEVFREWLLRDITDDDIRRKTDELLLRFAFYSTLDEPGASRHFLNELADKAEEYLKAQLAQRATFTKDGAARKEIPVHARMTMEFGIEQYRALARWARKAVKHFDSET